MITRHALQTFRSRGKPDVIWLSRVTSNDTACDKIYIVRKGVEPRGPFFAPPPQLYSKARPPPWEFIHGAIIKIYCALRIDGRLSWFIRMSGASCAFKRCILSLIWDLHFIIQYCVTFYFIKKNTQISRSIISIFSWFIQEILYYFFFYIIMVIPIIYECLLLKKITNFLVLAEIYLLVIFYR